MPKSIGMINSTSPHSPTDTSFQTATTASIRSRPLERDVEEIDMVKSARAQRRGPRIDGTWCTTRRLVVTVNCLVGAIWLIWLGMLVEALTDPTADYMQDNHRLWRFVYWTCLGLGMVGVGLVGALGSNLYLLGMVCLYSTAMAIYSAFLAKVDYSLPVGTNCVLAAGWVMVTLLHALWMTELGARH